MITFSRPFFSIFTVLCCAQTAQAECEIDVSDIVVLSNSSSMVACIDDNIYDIKR